MRKKVVWTGSVLLTAVLAGAPCGGGDSSPPTPPTPPAGRRRPPPPPPGGSGGSTPTTIPTPARGVSPQSITVPPGTRVTFINNDSRRHNMASDPHPEHTDCPEINQVGLLQTGQSRETGNLNTV